MNPPLIQISADGELSILILAILGVLAYVSVEYRYLYNGTPIFLMGVSVFAAAFWQVGMLAQDTMFIVWAVHGIGLAILVVLNEVDFRI